MLKKLTERYAQKIEKLDRDFDTAVREVHAVCEKLTVDNKVRVEVTTASLIVVAVELAYIASDGQRGVARDRLSEMIDKAFNDLERQAQKSGLDKALSKAADLARKGDHEGALRVAEEFGTSVGKV